MRTFDMNGPADSRHRYRYRGALTYVEIARAHARVDESCSCRHPLGRLNPLTVKASLSRGLRRDGYIDTHTSGNARIKDHANPEEENTK